MKPKDANPNEDFTCCYCMAEVSGRYLFCSQECEDKFNEEAK